MMQFLHGVMRQCGKKRAAKYYVLPLAHEQVANDIHFMMTCIGVASTCEYVKREDTWYVHVYTNDTTVWDHFHYKISVEEVSYGEYYGFEITGNRRFLLGDCTVTHNTVMAIYLMCQIRRKTLVVVHKDFLLEQWKERIEQFCPMAKVGTIKAQTVDVADKDIVIGSLQSLSMKTYDDNVFKGFGFVVVDEVHHTSAEVFCRALKKVSFKYTLGLSATIKRKDGLSKVFMWYLGDILYSNVKQTSFDDVHIRCLAYSNADPDYCEEHYLRRQILNMAKMINNVCDFFPRTQAIVDAIRDVLKKEPNRKMIVLSDRKSHLETLGECIKHQLGIDYGFYFGGMKPNELKLSESKPVILGTFQMVSEGFDCKSLDTLVLASPKADIVQSVGRILREEASKRKHVPLVIDVIDGFSVFEGQAKKRLAFYKKQKYKIMTMTGDDYDIQPSINNKAVVLRGFACRKEACRIEGMS
jgi:superfamily II DNA or RNA helicase